MLVGYEEKVYAGVLGKLIGVYLGRPIEGWEHAKIAEQFGEINYYVNEQLGKPLIVTDDDIAGMLTFVRAAADHDFKKDLTPKMIGETWMNYLVDGRSVIVWDSLGVLPASTAYYRMKKGILPPESGSSESNSRVLSEQIGSQIFADGWAMLSPGDPNQAAALAKAASQVAFDGEAIYGAQCWTAMEAQAFISDDIHEIIDAGLQVIPPKCETAVMIHEIREKYAIESDWRICFTWLRERYGYHNHPGLCPIIPNHGIMVMSLLYGGGSFHESMSICNTAGWDTDCNAGNLGCLLGIMYGLSCFEAGPDWRGPIADRLFVSTAAGGEAVTDALTEAYRLIEAGKRMAGEQYTPPKDGWRYHFSLSGSVQGFQPDTTAVSVWNMDGRLAIEYMRLCAGRTGSVGTDVFIPDQVRAWALNCDHYPLDASPAVYEGQILCARVAADKDNYGEIFCRMYVQFYTAQNRIKTIYGESNILEPGRSIDICWKLSGINGCPICRIGFELFYDSRTESRSGKIHLDYMGWKGDPEFTLDLTQAASESGRNPDAMIERMWVNACESLPLADRSCSGWKIAQSDGLGQILLGAESWQNYRCEAVFSFDLTDRVGLAVRVKGLHRGYAVFLGRTGEATLVRRTGKESLLDKANFQHEDQKEYRLEIEANKEQILVFLDGQLILKARETSEELLERGGISIMAENGKMTLKKLKISPVL